MIVDVYDFHYSTILYNENHTNLLSLYIYFNILYSKIP